ncbi:MAG: Crp/Fnr family transcriptional regulator [Paracoccaceae bacterium]
MQDWITRFTGLNALPDRLKRKLMAQSRIVTLKKGARVFGQGTSPENLLMLLEGTVRVQQQSETGREIVLYRVQAGESCVLTTACLLAYDDHSAEGIAETEVKAAAIPRLVFEDLITDSTEFRQFVFQSYSRRITDLFFVIDELAFRRVDIRLAQKLLVLQDDDNRLSATHQQLAAELGTAREVISRQLQEFQRRGLVELSRGVVQITDLAALKKLSKSE